jgi:hypothetical protein
MNRLQQARRQTIGYQYGNQNNSQVTTQPYMRTPSMALTASYEQNTPQGGEGLMDVARDIYNKGKNVASYLQNAYTSETASDIRNTVASALPSTYGDNTYRPGYPNERYAVLRLKNGNNGIANYMGPNTNLLERLKRGDPGRTEVDRVSKAHDIRYHMASKIGDIRKADDIMIGAVKQIERNKTDNPRNIMLAKAITLKKIGENLGVIKRDAFSGPVGLAIDPNDKKLLNSNLDKLSQVGYGLPGDELKKRILKQLKRAKGKKGKQKGGFFFFLFGALITLITEAVSTVTIASVGSAIATGAASAVAGVVTKKIIGGGRMKGRGIGDVAQNAAKTVATHVNKVVAAAKSVGITEHDIPSGIRDTAKKALAAINANANPSKESVLKLAKTLIPHVRKVFHKKLENKIQSGSGIYHFLDPV